MTETTRRAELKAFLRARRAAIAPENTGLWRGKRRLTPGLRREEVAALAGVGLTWYTWLEQGRDINVSSDTLRRVARVLRLSASDEAYLFSLAGAREREQIAIDAEIPPTLKLVLDGFGAGPALVLDPIMNVLAYNALADEVYAFNQYEGPRARNHLWRAVMDPVRRQLYVQWEEGVRNFIGLFRLHAAAYIDDPEYMDLIASLCAASQEFDRIWNERETRPLEAYELLLQHPRLGRLRLHSVRFPVESFPGLVVFLPPADSATEAAFAAELARQRASKTPR